MGDFLEAELSPGVLQICSRGLCHISMGYPVPSGDEGALQDAALVRLSLRHLQVTEQLCNNTCMRQTLSSTIALHLA